MEIVDNDCTVARMRATLLQEKQKRLNQLLSFNQRDLRESERIAKQMEGGIMQNKNVQNNLNENFNTIPTFSVICP